MSIFNVIVSEKVQEEFEVMENTINRERMKSRRAVSIASHMYRKNSALKVSVIVNCFALVGLNL